MIFDNTLETHVVAGCHYGFSAKKIEHLGATEYTLATIVTDTSPSTSGFVLAMEEVNKAIATACKLSPRANNLMLRNTQFNSTVIENHGFKLLFDINNEDYTGILKPRGSTALYDATNNALVATEDYAEQLFKADYSTNGIVFVITDGQDNSSTLTPNSIKDTVAKIRNSEHLESLIIVLIGVNVSGSVDSYLQNFNTEAGFDKYIGIADCTPASLAKLAEFVSKSIASQSNSLGSGNASTLLAF